MFKKKIISINRKLSHKDYFSAATKGDLAVVESYTRKKGERYDKLNAIDKKGNTALIMAAFNNHYNVVMHLLYKKANYKHKNNSGLTAEDVARAQGNMNIADLLHSTCYSISIPYEQEYDQKHPTYRIIHELSSYLMVSKRFKNFTSEEILANDSILRTKLEWVMEMLYSALVNINQKGEGNKYKMLCAIDSIIRKNDQLANFGGFFNRHIKNIRSIVFNFIKDNKEANFSLTPKVLYEFNILHPVLTLCEYSCLDKKSAVCYSVMKLLVTKPYPHERIEKMLTEGKLTSKSFFANEEYLREILTQANKLYSEIKTCFFSGGAAAKDISNIVMEYTYSSVGLES